MKNEPIFKNIFGHDWANLPPVMQKHYANRAYSNDITTVEGALDVMCAGPIKALAWIFWLLRGIPPYSEKNVPVTVSFESDTKSKSFHFNRIFHFNTRESHSFKSRMVQVDGNEVVELMQYRVGWRMNYVWEDERVKLKHKGYVLYLMGKFIPVPLGLLLGVGNAQEVAVNDNEFDMVVTMTHPLWGKIYEYKGRFTVKENA